MANVYLGSCIHGISRAAEPTTAELHAVHNIYNLVKLERILFL